MIFLNFLLQSASIGNIILVISNTNFYIGPDRLTSSLFGDYTSTFPFDGKVVFLVW